MKKISVFPSLLMIVLFLTKIVDVGRSENELLIEEHFDYADGDSFHADARWKFSPNGPEGTLDPIRITSGSVSNVSVYLNGQPLPGSLIRNSPFSADILNISNTSLRVGVQSEQDISGNMKGMVDDLILYNRALSSNEVAQLYEAQSGTGDADGDGVNNYREGKDGTNPNDATSFNPLSKGLVAYYPFDGNADDESGFENNGQPYRVSYVHDRFGTSSTACDFRDNAYVEIPNLRSNKNYPVTYSTWMYMQSYHTMLSANGWGVMHILGKDQPGDWNGAVLSIHRGDRGGKVEDVLTYTGYQTDYVPPLAQWILVTLTIGADRQATYYVDGTPIATWSATTQYNYMETDLPFRISTPYIFDQYARQSLQGYLDSVRIYDRALSPAEVAYLYYQEAFNEQQQTFLSSHPFVMGHFSQADYQANRTNGQTDVTTNPSGYGLFTQTQYDTFGTLQFSNGQSSVTTNPSAFNLFTKAQFDANRTSGQSDVTSNPNSFGLYTVNQYNANHTNGVQSVLTSMPSVELSVPSSAFIRAGLGTTNITAITASTLPLGWQFDSSTHEVYGRLLGTNPASALLTGLRPTGETIPVTLNFTPVPSEVASISLPLSRSIQASKTVKLPITVWNNSASSRTVTVEFTSSDESKLPAPADINISVPGKNTSSGRPGRANGMVNLTAGDSGGEVELIASVGGVSSAPCAVTIKSSKRR